MTELKTEINILAGPSVDGRLSHLLAVRGEKPGTAANPEAPIVIQSREALIYTLGKAAELEHLVLCQYLFAAFSMKRDASEGLAPDMVETVKRWRLELSRIAEQEMLHLALVQNLLTAVGGAPRLGRANFPVPIRSWPADVRMVLLPFGEVALRHFAFLERPEGMAIEDVEEFAAIEKATPLPRLGEDEMAPYLPDFATIGHLYRAIENGLEHLAEKMGADRLFIGPPRAQATAEHFRWDELVAVTDMVSARRAIDTIVEQGEGARGDWKDAHFGRLIRILDEFLEARDANPTFDATRPVLAASVRLPDNGETVPIITDLFTIRCVDLLNAVYEVLLQVLARYFAHTDETDEQLGTLADVAVGLMEGAIKTLGNLVTKLPVGPDYPGLTAGPTFELFYSVDYLLPHREAAWALMAERLREVADLAMRCREVCIPIYMSPLSKVTQSLLVQADLLVAEA